MAFSKRGLRLVDSLTKLSKEKSNYYDFGTIFNKIKFTAANDEILRGTLTVDVGMCNPYNIMHGGCIASIIDVMCLYAHVAKPNSGIAFTTNMTINFIGSARVGDKVTVEATAIKSGKSPIMESLLFKENGDIIAKGTASFLTGSEKLQEAAFNILGFDMSKND